VRSRRLTRWVYEALSECRKSSRLGGGHFSIGASTRRLLPATPLEKRGGPREGLRRFWERIITSDLYGGVERRIPDALMKGGRWSRGDIYNTGERQFSTVGRARLEFFVPRLPSPWLHPRGSIEATQLLESRGYLKNTLKSLRFDFDRSTLGEMRFQRSRARLTCGAAISSISTRPPHDPARGK